MKAHFEGDKDVIVLKPIQKFCKQTNEEWLKSLSTEELAEELARIAEWDREQVKKAKRTVGLVEFMKQWLGEKHKEKQKK